MFYENKTHKYLSNIKAPLKCHYLILIRCPYNVNLTGLFSADIEQVEKNKIQTLTVIIPVANVEFPKTILMWKQHAYRLTHKHSVAM